MDLKKAKLTPASGEKGEEIIFMFNPTQLQFTRSVGWGGGGGSKGRGAQHPLPAEDKSLLPKANFSGIQPYTLTISNIIFDTYETRKSVRDVYIKTLETAVNPTDIESKNPKDKRPPVYRFEWGNQIYIKCVVTTLKFIYEMFLPDGTPVRAKVTLTLQEVDQVNDTNTNAQPKRKTDGRPRPK
jgi:Contractile injection system tube protein